MANTNNGTQKNNNYFTNNKQKFGDNFLNQKSAQDIQRDAKKKIFKDMIFGNIDYGVDGMYFTNATFLDNLITVASVEADVHTVTAAALQNFALMNGGDRLAPVAAQKATQHANTSLALQILLNTFVMIKGSDMDISYLPNLNNLVYMYRRDFSEFY